MIRLVRFLLGLLALDVRGQRAVDATLADWRHELARTTSFRRRLLVNARSSVGVARTLVSAGVLEFSSVWRTSFVVRLAAIAVLWVIWVLQGGAPGSTDRFFLVASQTKAWALVALSLVPQFILFFPLMVFLAEAIGRRNRSTPVIGLMVLLTSFGLVVGLVLLPASVAYLRYETWRYFANASVPEPQVSILFLLAPTVFATTSVILGIWLLFGLATRVRRVGGVTGWTMAVGVILAPNLFFALLRFLPASEVRIGLMLSQLPLTLAAILWATLRLARIEAARSAELQMTNNQ